MSTETLNDVLREIKSLEPLPQVAMRVVQLASQEDVIPRELVEVIQTDAGITAKVLKLCNSALFGFRREIASLPEAGNLLGVSTLVNLVLTSCASRYFRDYGRGGTRKGRARWEESVSNALAASLIAGLTTGVDRSRAYTCGLLMNVGHTVLDRYVPERARELDVQMESGLNRLQAEHVVVGIDHAEIGARLAERWNLPDLLVDSIRHHHDPAAAEVDEKLASVAHLGEMFTSALDMGEGLENLAYELKGGALGVCGMDRSGFEKIEQLLRAELDRAREVVDL
jgi:HD-like signal output (HDOD) protein